ncbi:chemotaxis protein CheA [Sporolituus thermophilus]|uniref:Chemotaxis protein CheA n=1 Tax=Sporolituus thermophilus DSM 23256 TaxID=1123285 RepID=A0A1G7KQS3_9FIRM|nr:chemotaxis protein CheA [Sporolituus thermophilus]SDF39424.1 two-component system, chemotaxis family, sensor kinase CheA [Sporolituus thermophilus DSM 23256]
MDTSQYMGVFLEETREHLQTLNRCLLELEQDPGNLAVLDEIFRSAHTIKGMSATMGFTAIAELTHEMENILDLLRKSVLKANSEIIDALFKCVDNLEQLVEQVAVSDETNLDIKPLVATLTALAKGETSTDSKAPSSVAARPVPAIDLNDTETQIIQAANSQGLRAYAVQVRLREGCLLKSARAYMVMSTLDTLGDVIKSIPPAEELEKENFDLSFQAVIISDAEPDKIKQSLLSIAEIESVNVILCEAAPRLEKAAAVAGPGDAESKRLGGKHHEETEKTAIPGLNSTVDKKVKGGQSVRVDIEKLDTLLNLVGELVINKTRLEQIGITHRLPDLVETIEQMDRVTTDLQAVVMKVRMVPVGQVFNRFPRMIRDLSRELNKEVNLIIQGEETELDRTVIDEIGDPLVHLLRNAIDHGIESPEEREAKGKNPVGEIRLIARHEGNNVIIVVEDDGRGINPETVKQKAVQKGLISQAEADKMDVAEAIRLIFLPGFSTADNITDLSGRGVGMDAVKTKIESLGGMVDVETKVNEGSKFKIRLPLTLAIIQALLVKVGEEIYAIPLSSIDSTIKVGPADIKTIQNHEVILLRGQIIPIVRLAKVLNVPETGRKNQEELFVVIIHMGEQRAGVVVDTLIGQQEIVIKSLGKLLAGIKVIAGATILGNGQVALILDVGSLM